jgi:hypothetical protein
MIANTKLAVLLTVLLLGLLSSPSQAQPACIAFEPPPFPLGTTYGAPVGQVSGDLVFVASGISGYVYKFILTNGNPAFNRAFIDFAPVAFSPGQSLRTNNINLLFDFTGLGFTATKVTLSYLDLGGNENLAVNSSGIYVGEITSAPAGLGGASVTVTSTPVPPPISGKRGTVTVKGPVVKSLLIGGQEFWIDSVCAQ